MKTSRITLERITLKGFRAFLESQSLCLRRGSTPLSLAVFAPNAKGKSSLVDSFEFFLSEDATLKRLGKRAQQGYAGPSALEHVEADMQDISPSVHLEFRQGQKQFGDRRTAYDSRPTAADRILARTKVPFIIRGYELRGFVEGTTPGHRYKELAGWFALDPLVTIQQNFRALRSRVKQSLESTSAVYERSRDIERVTEDKVSNWDTSSLMSWINDDVLHHLDSGLSLTALSDQDLGFIDLRKRRDAELERLGIAQLKGLLGLIAKLTIKQEGNSFGSVSEFENAALNYSNAAINEQSARSKAANAVFNDVWHSAKLLFDNNDNLTVCPICDTPFASSPHKSQHNIHISLSKKLSELEDYRRANKELTTAEAKLTKVSNGLQSNLASVIPSLKDSGYDSADVATFYESLQTWQIDDDAPSSLKAVSALASTDSVVLKEIERIEKKQGEHTYAKAFDKLEELFRIKADLDRIARSKAKLGLLHKQLGSQTHTINVAIKDHINGLIGSLGADIQDTYNEIQGSNGDSLPIHIKLPEEEKIDQQRAELVIDFSANRKGVVPSGYLSDSQIHTLALALRLAAIRLLNKAVPILVLDDVVSSYDADHRKRIAGVLAKYFTSFQVVIVTHDEQFFNLLRDQLPEQQWLFRRITEIRPAFGPVFDDHKTSDEVIQERLDSGKRAANEIRQAEEEWLVDICRQFRTKVDMRPSDHAYRYERSELANSLASYLNKIELTPPQVPGVDGSFLGSLQKGVVENPGSHYSDNPHQEGSVGDDRTRWEEFVFFRNLFTCPSCGKRRFHRPQTVSKPLCRNCQTLFDFESPDPSSP